MIRNLFILLFLATPALAEKGNTMRSSDMRTPWLAVSWTLYLEARSTTAGGTQDGDLRDVASVILSDAGGDLAKLRQAALNPKRFSCWKPDDAQRHLEWPDKPGTPDYAALTRCQRIANEIIAGRFVPTLPQDGTIMYHAKSIQKPDTEAWRKAKLVRQGVKHVFYWSKV